MVRILKRLTDAVSAFIASSIHSRLFFAGALVCLPAFLLMESLIVKSVFTLAYIVLMVLTGKKFRLVPNIVIFASITILNLFTPVGRVLASFGPFTLTGGALLNGVMKSVTFIGLVYLSRFSVRRDLEFPGKPGALLGRTLMYFDMITGAWAARTRGPRTKGARSGLNREGLIERLDNLFFAVSARTERVQEGGGERKNGVSVKTTWKGFLCVALFVAVHWGVFILDSIIP